MKKPTTTSQYLPAQTKALQSKIKHIVVLMLENHSFDNMLGWLYEYDQVPNNQNFEGLNWDLWNPLNNVDADGIPFIEKVPIEMNGQKKEKYGRKIPNPVDFCLPNPDPGEGFKDTNFQLFSNYQVAGEYPPAATNFGFVNNYQKAMLYGAYSFGDAPTNPRDIMKCYTKGQTPVLSTLAQSFAVCDHYHASVPSQTLPNRSFVHAATSEGSVNNSPNIFTHSDTVYNRIEDAINQNNKDLSWGIFGNNMMPTSSAKHKKDKSGEFGKDHFSLTRLCMTKLHNEKYNANFDTVDQFIKLCETGDIPSYSFIEPTYGGPNQNDQHPPSDIRPGEKLIADLYNAIRTSPVFEETLFVITYDEHGGCYDHVAPPKALNPDPNNTPGQDGFLFNRMGVRVPCVLINPYIPKGTIARPSGYTAYDHTSIIKTVFDCFGIDKPLTQRDASAPNLSGVLTLTKARKKDIPTIDAPSWDSQIDESHDNDLHRQMLEIIEKLSGKQKPQNENVLTFIQENYNTLFTSKRKSKN